MSNDLQPLNGAALGNQYALHALRERRAERAGEQSELLRRLSYLKHSIASLDATLAIMSPGFDASTIKPKRPRKKAKLFGAGKLNAMILDAMRRADRPMPIVEVCEAIGEMQGFGPNATAGLRNRVRAALLYLTKVRGLLVKDGDRRTARWALAHSADPEHTQD